MNFYNLSATDIDGNEVSMEEYEGQVVLVVNTASKCGFTPQYEDLQKLYLEYKDQGLEILGFPCNQFEAQEPGSNDETKTFCTFNYGVSFPLFEKVDVNGPETHPVFDFLKSEIDFEGVDMSNMTNKIIDKILDEKYPEYKVGNAIRWNFTKFLVDRNGNVVKRFESSFEPRDLAAHIKPLL